MNASITRALGLFGLTFMIASWQGWTAGDIAWSMWLASLVTGYIWILVSIFSGLLVLGSSEQPLHPNQFEKHSRKKSRKQPKQQVAGGVILILQLIIGLFMLAFFTVHFGGFHAGHAVFLNAFFPLTETGAETAGLITEDGTMEGSEEAMNEMFASPLNIPLYAFLNYWPFLLFAMMDKLPALWRSLQSGTGINMMSPYGAVVKNHIMIIALGFISVLVEQRYILYILMIFYFFPFGELWQSRKKKAPEEKRC
jgi:hypothetical protein